jgi:hypothetical protein
MVQDENDSSVLTVQMTIVFGFVLAVIMKLWQLQKEYYFQTDDYQKIQQTKHKRAEHSACKNPNCVRCQRYRKVQQRAKSRLPWIIKGFNIKITNDSSSSLSLNHQRIPSAVRKHTTSELINIAQDNPWQKPTVLMVENLPSKEIVTEMHIDACNYLLRNSTRKIISQALKKLEENSNTIDSILWTVNDSPKGRWEVLHIMNQGTWNTSLLNIDQDDDDDHSWQKAIDLIQKIPGIMDGCLFGNVMVSKIYPGTIIEPHCGPTNLRHRLQYVLEIPSTATRENTNQSLSLWVGEQSQITWNNLDDVFVFDDSFLHLAMYPSSRQCEDTNSGQIRESRTVLIVDLWHPNLQDIEKMLVQQLYPPFPTSNT